ncbi:hypothetical protein CSE_05690 [Caldisericum exile AZM16c01]|uniref:Uncharacterized protein n=1 Tax=Caldisericum exile (strain DSM 21853 / NBRC 104410 / AZM16c01) TaxID=511051 RepID=A0A7U6GE45_CALEA|nr:hypothetical protein CSE_05690 [Caldisericum exile AZM16c01]
MSLSDYNNTKNYIPCQGGIRGFSKILSKFLTNLVIMLIN